MVMDIRLLQICMSGDEHALQELIQHDPLILDRSVTCCGEETPLHMAVLRRHLSLVRAVLGHEPELASERDASGCVPLHLASAKGSVEIVWELLSVDAELCGARDRGGRTPLHLAVMKGRLDVVRELIRARPRSISVRFDWGETVFHLSVRCCHFEVLKLLVELLRDDHRQLLVATDDEGNTVLYFAAFFKQVETVRYLLSLKEVKAIASNTNSNGHTTLDEKITRDSNIGDLRGEIDQPNISTIVIHSPLQTAPNSAHKDTCIPSGIVHIMSQIRRCLCWSLYIIAHIIMMSPIGRFLRCVGYLGRGYLYLRKYLLVKYHEEWMVDAHGNMMVVATVIARMSFQAGMNPPGGVWQADTIDNTTCSKPGICRAGTAVLRNEEWFGNFYSNNSWALIAALGVVLLNFMGVPLKNKVGTWFVTLITCLMLDNIFGAYAFSTAMVVGQSGRGNVTLLHIRYAWGCMLQLIVIIHSVRIWYWLLLDKLKTFVDRSGHTPYGCRWVIIVVITVVYYVGIFIMGFLVRIYM